MKGMDIIKQKAKSALSMIIMISSLFINGQSINTDEVTQEEYDVINSMFSKSSSKIKIKSRSSRELFFLTDHNKLWSLFFTKKYKHLLDEKKGIGGHMSYDELMKLLSSDVRKSFYSKLMGLRSYELETRKINNIKLSKSLKYKNSRKHVFRISKPIIVNNIAVIRNDSSENECTIYFFIKNEEWEMIYSVDEWLILH